MAKEMYRVFYFETVYHRGETYREMRNKVITDTLENIVNGFDIYFLTDINGNAIIDNRKRGK